MSGKFFEEVKYWILFLSKLALVFFLGVYVGAVSAGAYAQIVGKQNVNYIVFWSLFFMIGVVGIWLFTFIIFGEEND